MAADAVRAYPGRCVLYAGEALLRGSQTAGPALATALAEGGYSLQRPALPLPRWPGTADCLYVFGRAECPGAPRATGLASTTTPATPFDTAAAAVARSELVAAQSAEWAAAASAHVARRVLRGGVRAAPGVEQAAVRAAAAAAPLARRLLLRALCL